MMWSGGRSEAKRSPGFVFRMCNSPVAGGPVEHPVCYCISYDIWAEDTINHYVTVRESGHIKEI